MRILALLLAAALAWPAAAQTLDKIRKSGTLSHILTFFEWEYGVLPFTKALAALRRGASS